MKTLLTIAIGVMINFTTYAQPMEKDFWLWAQRDTIRTPHIQKPYELVIVPRPQSIRMKGNKVIVVYNKREWIGAQRLNRMRAKGMMRRVPGHRYPNKK